MDTTNTTLSTPNVTSNTGIQVKIPSDIPASTFSNAPSTLAIPNIPTPTVPNISSDSALQQAKAYVAQIQPEISQAEKDRQTFVQQYKDLLDTPAKESATAQAYKDTGINDIVAQINDYTAQITAIDDLNQAKKLSIGQNVGGLTVSGVQNEETRLDRESAIKKLNISASLAAVQGKFNTAKSLVDQAITIKYADQQAKIDRVKAFLDLNKEDLSKEEKKQTQILAERQRILDEKKAKEMAAATAKIEENKTLDGLIKSLSENGSASPEQITYLVKNAKTIDDFYSLGGGSLLSKEATKFIEMPDGSTVMVNTRTGDEIRRYGNTPTTETGENQNALTYARQYATDGKLPSLTDLQKLGTSPAEITRMAKELPKQPGQIVSTQTGVKDTSIPAAAQDDFTKLYNITQNIAKLKELDEKRIGGLAAGALGKVFGSDDQAAYLTARKAIVDDLSRMQSGAALTLDEVAFYEDYLPGRFSEFLGLGQDSMKKIENFETQMNNKLKDRLGTNGLTIYGYSTINLGGKDYKVGDEIEVNGNRGRVLPGGEVSVQGSPISSVATSSSKVVGGIDLKGYAVDPNQSKAVASIYNKIPNTDNPADYTNYIKSKSPNSKISGDDIVQAASSYNLDPKILLALMQHESNIGTSTVALKNNNFGGITWSESYARNNPRVIKGSARPASEGGYYVKFTTPLDGLMAQAKLLSKRKTA